MPTPEDFTVFDELAAPLNGPHHDAFLAAAEDKPAQVEQSLSAATKAKYTKPNIFRGVVGRFPRAMTEIARVSEFGCEKHEVSPGDMGYLDVPDAGNVYREAELRHLVAEATDGSVNTADGNLLHRAQKAWNALADLEQFLRGPRTTD